MFFMSVSVKRKDGESTGSLLRRFSYLIKRSGVLNVARKKSFFHKEKNKRQRKDEAIKREKILAYRRELEEAGVINPGQPIPQELMKKIRIDNK